MKIMDRETWLTANQCVEHGFVDEIMDGQQAPQFVNSYSGMWLTDELRQKAADEKKALENKEAEKRKLLEDLDFYGV